MATKADHKSRRKTAGWERSMTRKLLTLTVLTSAMFLSANGMEHDDCECHDDPSHSSDYPQHARRPMEAANDEPTEVEKRLMLAHYYSDSDNMLAGVWQPPISTAFQEFRGDRKYDEAFLAGDLLASNNYEKKIQAFITLKEFLRNFSHYGIEDETYLKLLSDVNGVRGIMWAALYRCFRNGYPISMAGIMDGGVTDSGYPLLNIKNNWHNTEDEEAKKAVEITNDESTDPDEVVSVIDNAIKDAEVRVEIKKIQSGWQEWFEVATEKGSIVARRGIQGVIASMDSLINSYLHLDALQRAGFDVEGIREFSKKITDELEKLEKEGGVFEEAKIQYWFNQIMEKVSQITNTLNEDCGFHIKNLDKLKAFLEAFKITMDATLPLSMAPDQDYIDRFLSRLSPDNKQSLLNHVRNDQMKIPSDADYRALRPSY